MSEAPQEISDTTEITKPIWVHFGDVLEDSMSIPAYNTEQSPIPLILLGKQLSNISLSLPLSMTLAMAQVHLISYQNCFINFLKLFLLPVLSLLIRPPYQSQCHLPKMQIGLNHYLKPFQWFPITEWHPSSLVQPRPAPVHQFC